MTHPCTCGWDVDYAQVCTATPGELHPSAGYLTLCPPENDCTDAVMHRAQGTGWHTRAGTTVSGWYGRHLADAVQLDLFEATA